MPPETPAERGLAVVALGRFALATDDSALRGEALTLADLTAAAHLSCLDYVGDVPWGQYPGAKDWYAKIKSRPGFRGLLADHVAGMPPPKLYANLDF